MLEVGDHYVGADILLVRGDEMVRGHLVAQSHEAGGNFMGGAHTNSILITRMY